ncbi:MAG: hypothetical protein AB8F74_20470, partial [Saprospiraceae bacterium]
ESQVTTIEFVNGVYIINEVGDGQDLLPNLEYQSEGDYIQFFDANTRPLTNELRFDFVSLNGVQYDTIIDLITAINELD